MILQYKEDEVKEDTTKNEDLKDEKEQETIDEERDFGEEHKDLGEEFKEEKDIEKNEDLDEDGQPDEEYTTWDGKTIKTKYSGKELKALRGNMLIEYPENIQIVRIFTSSTFTG